MEKSIPELKAEFECMCVREKNSSFNYFNVYKKCKSPLQKGF